MRTGTRSGVPLPDELVGVPLVLHEPEGHVYADLFSSNGANEDVATVFVRRIAQVILCLRRTRKDKCRQNCQS